MKIAETARAYGRAETARTLARLHVECFARWLSLGLEQQTADLTQLSRLH